MKLIAAIIIAALPFTWLALYLRPLIQQAEIGLLIIEGLSLAGYWPVTIAFHIESAINALLTMIPYAFVVALLCGKKKGVATSCAIVAYAVFSFLFCFRYEHLSSCLYTLTLSANVYSYFAIGFLIYGLSKVNQIHNLRWFQSVTAST